MKWVALRTAPNEPIAESWAELLRINGVPARVPHNPVMQVYLGSGTSPVPVQVPENREEEGRSILEDLLEPLDEVSL
ncbi:MAG: hypothetical protein IIC82_00625 [Chloroflexi bacterium]|nr:hypothetical protein [Chloroflexota bacterium]